MITGNAPAYRDALFNIARFGASRFGAFDQRAFISIGGIVYGDPRPDAFTPGILRGSLTVNDVLDDTPNTCSFTAWNFQPPVGAEVLITLGSVHNSTRVFAGYVLSTNQVYAAVPKNRMFHCSCIDYTWRLMQAKAYGRYVGMSATAIVNDLLARFAPSVSNRYVQAGLPGVDEIIITNEDLPSAFKRIAARVGAYFYVDYGGALHFFTTQNLQPPRPLTPDHPSLSAVEREVDLSQVVTRALSEGGGGNTLIPLSPGAATIPVDVASWYATGGGRATVGPNRITYTGVANAEEKGTLVGPGVTPSSAPAVVAIAGGTLPVGAYQYAFTFQTAAGETKPSPLATVSAGVVPTPTTPPEVLSSEDAGSSWTSEYYNTGGFVPGDTVDMAYSFGNDGTIDARGSGPLSPIVTQTAHTSPYQTSILGPTVTLAYAFHIRPPWVDAATQRWSYDPNAKFLFVWWRVNGGPWFVSASVQANPNTGGGNNFITHGQVTAVTPPTVGPTVRQIQVSNVATGPASVTNRKIYRTTVGGSQLKFLITLAGNVSSGPLTDTAADASLGANAPVGDTSGIQGPSGQVLPGDTTMIVAGTSWADPAGGWAVIGNGRQTIRYSGTTGGSLTGIPATGVGSIVAAVSYNSTITGAPTLTGIPATGENAVRYAVPEDTPVNVLAVADDAPAQSALAAVVPGHSGIVEEWISDGRLSLLEATARASALLNARSAPMVTLRYTSRDVTTQSGTTVSADLAPPTDIHDTLKIQQVTIDNFNVSPTTATPPTYHVTASSARFSFEDLLRQARPAE